MEVAGPQPSSPWMQSPGPWSPDPSSRPGKRARGGEAPNYHNGSPGPWASSPRLELAASPPRSRSPGPWRAAEPKAANLNFDCGSVGAALLLASQSSEVSQPLNKYQQQGSDAARVTQRYQTAAKRCRCHCRRCYLKIKLQSLLATAKAYWSMTTLERGHLLRALHQGTGHCPDEPGIRDTPGSHTAWQLCSQPVCLSVFAHLLGTSQNSIWKAVYCLPDLRALRQPVPSGQSQLVDFFFYELYNSAAEPLPDQPGTRLKAGSTARLLKMNQSIWWLRGAE